MVIVLLGAKCYISNGEFMAVKSYSDAIYKEYMTALSGELTDAKRGFIADERAYINSITDIKDEMLEKYLNEKISFEEYREYITEYNYAYSRSELFKRVEEHAHYIEQTAEQKNIDAWFVYDTRWIKLFHRGFDIILYIMLLLLFSGKFADEYSEKSSSGSFAQILRTAKNGRKRTFYSKLVSALTITAILTIIFNAVDLIIIFKNYDLPAINAPLVSMQSFAAINGGVTIMQYLIIYFLTSLIANSLFTAFVCGLSALLKKTVFVMGVSVAVTLFPALFAYFGLGIFSYFDFTGLLSATQIYLLSARTNLLGDTGFFAIFTLSCAAISCGLLYKSEKEPAAKALLEACKGVKDRTETSMVEYMGFKMSIQYDSHSSLFKLNLRGNMTYQTDLGTDAFGNITRINNTLEGLPKRLDGAKSQLDGFLSQQEAAKQELGKPFASADELAEKEARLALLNAELNIDGSGGLDVENDADNQHDSDDYIEADDEEYDDDEPEYRRESAKSTRTPMLERLANFKPEVKPNTTDKKSSTEHDI